MSKLLTAGWYRIRTSRVFWGVCAIVVYLGIYCGNLLRGNDWSLCLEVSILLAIVILSMAILNVVTEYSSHAMRNKLSAGHTKTCIFFAELILNVEITCVLLAGMLLVAFIMAGGTLQGIDGGSALIFLVMFFLFYIELTVMVTVTGLLFASSIQGGIISMVALFGVPGWICSQIQMYFINDNRYNLNVEKKAMIVRSVLIHHDISEEAARIWQTIFDMLLGGQLNHTLQCVYVFLGVGTFRGITGFEKNIPVIQSLYSLLGIAVFVIVGYLFFRKKDMK